MRWFCVLRQHPRLWRCFRLRLPPPRLLRGSPRRDCSRWSDRRFIKCTRRRSEGSSGCGQCHRGCLHGFPLLLGFCLPLGFRLLCGLCPLRGFCLLWKSWSVSGVFLGSLRHLGFNLPWVGVVLALGVRKVRTGYGRVPRVLLVSLSVRHLGSFGWDVLSVIVLREPGRSAGFIRAFRWIGRAGGNRCGFGGCCDWGRCHRGWTSR